MKKIYTLLAGVMVAGSAFAIVPNTASVKNVDMKDVMSRIEALEYHSLKSEMSSLPQGMMRAQDATGAEWSVMVSLRSPMTEVLSGIQKFGEYPFYLMNMNIQCMEQSNDNQIPLFISWPSNVARLAFSSSEMYNELYKEAENGLEIDETAALKYFKTLEEAYAPSSFDDLAQLFEEDNDGAIRMYMLPAPYYRPMILPSGVFGTPMKWNGTEYLSMSATEGSNGNLDLSNATYIDWRGLDEQTSDIDLDITSPYCAYTTQPNGVLVESGSRLGIAATQVSGNALLLGFANLTFNNFQEVHIFNVGRITYGTSPESWLYPTKFDPLNQYFLCWCHSGMAYMAHNSQTDEDVQNYTNNSLPQGIGGVGIGGPGYRVAEEYEFTYMKAALWAPENSETPYGFWEMPEAEYERNSTTGAIRYLSAPAPYELIEPLNCDAGIHDGFSGLYSGYRMNAEPLRSWIGIGDKTYGFNFKFASQMTGDYYISGNFKGNIFYHPTPNKWVDEVTALPSVSTLTADAINKGESSVESVISNSPVVSSTYYNLQGQRISNAPENGIYIVRNVKADGTVEAVKVVK